MLFSLEEKTTTSLITTLSKSKYLGLAVVLPGKKNLNSDFFVSDGFSHAHPGPIKSTDKYLNRDTSFFFNDLTTVPIDG